MERYRIIQHNIKNKTFLVESTSGKVEIIEEGVFKDTFIKMKDAFMNFVRKGNRILVKIGGKIVDGVNSIYNIALNKKNGTHIFLGEESSNIASDLGISDTNDDFDTYIDDQLKRSNENCLNEIINGITYQAKLYLDELKGSKKIDEAWDTDYTTSEDIFHKIWPTSSSNSYPLANNIDAERNMRNKKFAKNLTSDRQDIDDSDMEYPDLGIVSKYATKDTIYDINEVIKELETRFDAITKKTWDGNPDNKLESGGAYKPLLIFGPAGIGKTSIVKSLKKTFEAKLGKKVNLVALDGTTMNEFSFTSPISSKTNLYRLDKDGNPVYNKEGKPFVLQSSEGVKTTLTPQIPSIDFYSVRETAINTYKEYGGKKTFNEYYHELCLEADETIGMGIIFIDEVSRMPEQLIQTFAQLSQTRSVGEGEQRQQLGTKWMIVAATNPRFDEAGAGDAIERLVKDGALLSRVDIVHLIPNFETFIKRGNTEYDSGEYKGKKHLHRLLYEFMNNSTRQYHMMNYFVKVPKDSTYRPANPRDWEQLTQLIYDTIETAENGEYADILDKCENIDTLKQYINEICKAMALRANIDVDDFRRFANDNYLALSDKVCKEAWITETGNVEKVDGKPFKMTEINDGKGLTLDNNVIESMLYENAPFVKNGEIDKQDFFEHKLNYIDSILKFFKVGFAGVHTVKGKEICRGLFMNIIPNALYGKEGDENGKFHRLIGWDGKTNSKELPEAINKLMNYIEIK